MIRNLHIAASIVTIFTGIVALINVFYAITIPKFDVKAPAFVTNTEFMSYYFKIIIFFYLELTICLAFGYLKLKIILLKRNSGFWFFVSFPLITTILLSSAWTTFFNVSWIFVDISSIQNYNSLEFIKFLMYLSFSIFLMRFVGNNIINLTNNIDTKVLNLGSYIDEQQLPNTARTFVMIHTAMLTIVALYQFDDLFQLEKNVESLISSLITIEISK